MNRSTLNMSGLEKEKKKISTGCALEIHRVSQQSLCLLFVQLEESLKCLEGTVPIASRTDFSFQFSGLFSAISLIIAHL